MTKPVAAPEIFQIPLDQLDAAIVPPGIKPGSPEFEQAVIMHYALRYAAKGWQAMVTVNDGFVRVLAIPQQGMDPKDYVQGLLQNGFLEDALPILQALDGMIDDADIAYNLGICFSELGQTAESVEPLERCTRLAPDYTNAWVGLGVAYTRLGRITEAMRALQKAVALEPDNSSPSATWAPCCPGKESTLKRCPTSAKPCRRHRTILPRPSGSANACRLWAESTARKPIKSTPTSSSAMPIARSPIWLARPSLSSPGTASATTSTARCGWTRFST